MAWRSSGVPGPRRVLVDAGADGRDGGVEHLGRAVGVREALAEVDGAGGDGERRHLGEDRGAEPGELGRQRRAGGDLVNWRRHGRHRTFRRPSECEAVDFRRTDTRMARHTGWAHRGGDRAVGEPAHGRRPARMSPWAPLRHHVFAALFAAQLGSNIGTFFQTVAAAWLMGDLTTSPTLVALIQTASLLPAAAARPARPARWPTSSTAACCCWPPRPGWWCAPARWPRSR